MADVEHSVIAGYPIVLPDHRAAFHRQNPLWHKAWLDSIYSHLKPDDVVIDVGAEQGDLSALVASWVPDGGMVLVEPVAKFWPGIRETFSVNGLAPPLTGFVGFASDGTNGLTTSIGFGWPSAVFDDVVEDPGFQHLNERQDLPTVELDRLMGEPFADPTALIIDSEGSELLVLYGAEKMLDRGIQVWCAVHPDFMLDRYGHTPKQLLDYMSDLGYEAELLDWPGEVHVRFYRESLVVRTGDGNIAWDSQWTER